MSGDQHNQADPLDLETYPHGRDCRAASREGRECVCGADAHNALVAEVRRLREAVAEGETWGDGNRRVPGESFDDYNARMAAGLANIPDEYLARHPDGTLDTEPACWCNVPALLAVMRCPRHLGYYP